MEYLMLIGGLVLLVLSGNYLVDSATGVARYFKIPSVIIGLTIVAFGTSAPELLVSVTAGLEGHSSMALGNVIGSNSINSSVIVGITALICPFIVEKESISIDAMFMLFISGLLLFFGYTNNVIERWEGALLFLSLLIFVIQKIRSTNKDTEKRLEAEKENEEDEKNWPIWLNFIVLIVSMAGLSYGADFMVEGAVIIAGNMGISERVVAVTVIALGTSLPELTASVIAALKKEPGITIGNIIGSNIFNIGSVLAISSSISPIQFDAANTTPDQFFSDMIWLIGFEVMLIIGMINVTENYAKFRKSNKFISLFSAEDGLVGRIWGASALALYAYYIFTLLR